VNPAAVTVTALEGGLESLNREQREDEAKRALRAELADWTTEDLKAECARHYPPYWQGLTTETQAVFARLLRGLRDDEIRIDLHPEEARDATRACFALADHPGIFSRLAGALALVGANVAQSSGPPPFTTITSGPASPTCSCSCQCEWYQ